MSLKLCTDGLLLDLVPPSRIVSISYLSQTRENSALWPQARNLPGNHNTAEEILSAHPDLVLADNYTAPATLDLLRRSGIRLLAVPDANNFAAIRNDTRLVARAVGEERRGEMLIAHMDAVLRDLAAHAPARPIRVVGWGAGGYVPGRNTLFDAILTAAGGVNIAAGARDGFFDTEQLLLAHPDLLAYGGDRYAGPVLRDDQSRHPLILEFYARRSVFYPELLYSCGLPQSADAAMALRAQMLRAMAAR